MWSCFSKYGINFYDLTLICYMVWQCLHFFCSMTQKDIRGYPVMTPLMINLGAGICADLHIFFSLCWSLVKSNLKGALKQIFVYVCVSLFFWNLMFFLLLWDLNQSYSVKCVLDKPPIHIKTKHLVCDFYSRKIKRNHNQILHDCCISHSFMSI